MSSDIEQFVNLIGLVGNIRNIIFGKEKIKEEKREEIINVLYDWNRYKNIQEIVDLDNEYINDAIKEVLDNPRFIEIIKNNTRINIEELITRIK